MEDREMHKAICSDCKQECEVPFKPTEGKPVRCQDCFKKSRPQRSFGDNNNRFGGGNRKFGGNNSRGFSDRPREMHKATCSDCGKACEVPFKPTQGKPVRCKDCFSSSRN
ncbi:MAG: CxxC-x17-CxxC domain-containing protein [archaeon]